MRKCKRYLKRTLVSVLAFSMVFGTGITGWGAESQSVEAKKDLVIYFANWDVYNSDYGEVKDIPWEKVTYVNHAFWEIKPENGEYDIVSTDPEADLTNENAHFKQYAEYTQKYPDVNVMISVGGWTKCGYFSEMAQTKEGRDSFIQSCIDTMDTYTWVAGIDIDWEYPGVARESEGGTDQGCPVVGDDFTNYTLLLKEMREAFDAKYGEGVKKLTTCSSVNVDTIDKQDVASFAQYVDLINIMSYDMTGSYDPVTGHQSALKTVGDAHSVEKAVDYFLGKGVPSQKINIGSPLYCHGWGGVVADENGNVVGVPGSAEGYVGDKVWNILKAMELKAVEDGKQGWHAGYDEAAEAAYLYNDNPNSKYYGNYLTYENERSLQAKIDYIYDKNLAGLIIWESGGDSAVDEYPMITQMAKSFGIYDGEQTVYGQAGKIPEIDDTVSESGYPDPVREVVAGDGSKIFKSGTFIYYKGAVWKSVNDNSSDWPDNLPDGTWGESCWQKEFDVKEYVSQEEKGYWDWAADEGDYVFYDPDHDGVGGIYYAKAQTSNTANDAPDGIWGTNWEYITTLMVGDAAVENPFPKSLTEVVAGDGSTVFPSGTFIYYKGAVWKSINDNSNDWPDNLPDGTWGGSCWQKEFDVKEYVSQEEKGYWDWAADEGDYVFYDPNHDGVGGIYYAKAQTSNTANDAPDGIWGTNWEFVMELTLAKKQEEPSEQVTTQEPSQQQATQKPSEQATTEKPAQSTTKRVAIPHKVAKKKIVSKKKAIKLSWKKVNKVAGYQIKYSTTKKFTKKTTTYKTVKGNKTFSVVIKKLKGGKAYYVNVRAYRMNGKKKVYGKWGPARKVVTKK